MTPEELAAVHERLDELVAERAGRAAAHLERIRRRARWLGAQLAGRDVTRRDVEQRLARLVDTLDTDGVPLAPRDAAVQAAAAAFAEGSKQGAGA